MRATDRVRVARRRGVIGRNGHCAVQQVDEATSRAIRHRRTCRRHVVWWRHHRCADTTPEPAYVQVFIHHER